MTKPSTNGNGDRIQAVATITHLLIALGTIILACGITYASLVQRVSAIESKVPSMEKDHDLLVTINANIDTMKRDVSELKVNMTEHVKAKP